jgi:hypothetical protein
MLFLCGGNDWLFSFKHPRFMVEDQGSTIDAEPCQRQRRMKRSIWIDVFKMIAAFIAEISGDKEAFADALFDFRKKSGDIFNPVNGNNCSRMKEEKTSLVPAVKSRGLEQNEIFLTFKKSVDCRWKGSERIE